MTNEDKILSCYGHVNYKSIALMCNVSLGHVYVVMRKHGLKSIKKAHSSCNNIGTGARIKKQIALSKIERQNKLKNTLRELNNKYR